METRYNLCEMYKQNCKINFIFAEIALNKFQSVFYLKKNILNCFIF